MTNIASLVREWENTAAGRLSAREYRVRLPLWDAARIAALSDMYPRRGEAELISELLTAALDELQATLPYIPGQQVICIDEEGNPVHEDAGPTPRFLELSRQYIDAMARAIDPEAVDDSPDQEQAGSKGGHAA